MPVADVDSVMQAFDFTPVVIIGAARSGTNALRDAMTALPQFATWKCDEINPIWRFGNVRHPDDELPPGLATPKVRAFVRSAFVKIWRNSGYPAFVVEKTCANTLRVPFVDAILPEAKYIHIVRNGVDVLASAQKRWQGDLELPGLPYFLAKARYTPIGDLPYYGLSFLRSRVGLLLGRSDRLKLWGPRFAGMSSLDEADLLLLCARQWAASVDHADEALSRLDPSRVLTVRYEIFASRPASVISDIVEFLGADTPTKDIEAATTFVRKDSIGKGIVALPDLSDAIQSSIARPMARHGFGG